MKFRLFSAVVLLMFIVSGQESLLHKGIILDSIAIEGTSNESYALYLPQNFRPEKNSPIVFIFDPAARGRSGILPFVESAEKYQLILTCSNNSRNTAYAENFAIADRWFNDVFSKFKIDQQNIYGAGFSGGSRLISAIGVLSGAFKGIIGCGAAFSANASQMPYAADHFYYAGLVGTRDMNFQEMYEAGDWLDRIGMANIIISFEDDHRWPASEYILEAFDWFRFQEVVASGKPEVTELQETFISVQLTKAEALFESGQILLASEYYDRIAKYSAVLSVADSILARSEYLKKSREYKNARKSRDQIASKEKEWTDRLVDRIRQETAAENISEDFNWWLKELEKLEQNEFKEMRDMGHRLRRMIFAVAIENLELSLAQKNEKEIIYYSKLLLANWPENAYVHFRIASGYASLGMNDEALSFLESAIDLGWNNKEWILGNSNFKNLKTNPGFKLLLERL